MCTLAWKAEVHEFNSLRRLCLRVFHVFCFFLLSDSCVHVELLTEFLGDGNLKICQRHKSKYFRDRKRRFEN